ncbi:hypothetical protein [Noviherbaspirillum autotrophicum]|uniref:Uncharacterized protein n=1 Tax=Noviherbaspirillum autotrophicum TaxID=709839 RepID=A0A0C2BS79_9BURK|nr:hypothetical protein [Noviherbaspirillum autotrophicum]KIF80911.1 hypothetical protein TSA66_08890 [Noviherbaspirillum autotrophicum]
MLYWMKPESFAVFIIDGTVTNANKRYAATPHHSSQPQAIACLTTRRLLFYSGHMSIARAHHFLLSPIVRCLPASALLRLAR